MEINIDDVRQMLSHVILQSENACSKIADTDIWKNEKKMICTVTINGVDIPAQDFEDTLKHFVECVERHVDVKGFDEKVEEKAHELLKNHADNALDKLYNIASQLENIENTIIPHWSRKND